MITDPLLLGAIGGLAATIGALWRQLLIERRQNDADKRQASRLIFALLQQRAQARGESAPATVSTPEKPEFAEAAKLATRALNGDIESLLKRYLASDYPEAP